MLALWYSLHGYVTITVKGFSAERFVNMAAFRGVPLREVAREGASVTMKAAGGSEDILFACAEKTGCTVEILSYGGLPVILNRFRKKQVWSFGLLLFAAGLYVLSSFVWTVRVEGNERMAEKDILSACEEMGLQPAAWKKNVDTAAVTKGLLTQFSELSWVSVGIHGTDAVIRLAETIEKAEMVDRVTPCDVVAAQDGVIVSVTAERGTPLVQAGDVVQKGDVLISSELPVGVEGEEQYTDYTAAEGAVTARIWQRLTEEMTFRYEEKQYSGVEEKNGSILFSEKELDIIHPDGAGKWEKTMLSEQPLMLGDFRLPLSLKQEIWKEYEIVEKERTLEETKSLLEEKLRKKTENLLSPYGKIENIEIRFEEYADSVRAEAEATLLDRIDEKRPTESEERERENLNEF
ncbi:MAG: sporulation protein YqfD [Anaerotignum sp.]|nr:sporulation protein YqfD [Anaerotignum sp.]